jgi:hypothetical protein
VKISNFLEKIKVLILDKNNSFNFNNPETFLDCARFGSISASFLWILLLLGM